MNDPNALSRWFPLIRDAGLPVPKTAIVQMPLEAQQGIWSREDGIEPTEGQAESLALFFLSLAGEAQKMGFPCFLRTGHTSGKHDWKNTCFLPSASEVRRHVFNIIEYSETVSIVGLPWQEWAVREMLPVMPYGACPKYGNMPICKEFRFFVEDGVIRCWHPYWPADALIEGGANYLEMDYRGLCRMDNEAELSALAIAASKAVPGSWSIDLLETQRGWFVTDMAEAKKSFHWDGCQNRVFLP